MGRTMTLLVLGCIAAAGSWCTLRSAGSAEEKSGKGTPVKIDGLTSVTPTDWKDEAPPEKYKRTRLKQFRLPRVGADKEDAEVVVSAFFGKGSGGLQANVQRWKAMMKPPKGKSIDDVTKVTEMKAGDVPVTAVEIYGTYKGLPFEQIEPKKNFRVIKIYFDSKNGPFFITLQGPNKTVEKYKKGFYAWLKAFK